MPQYFSLIEKENMKNHFNLEDLKQHLEMNGETVEKLAILSHICEYPMELLKDNAQYKDTLRKFFN